MNMIQIMGHLGADPETRVTPNGHKMTVLRVATNIRRGGKDETLWWRCVIWGEEFDKMIPYFKKGSAIIVVGEMGRPDIYTDKEGRQQVSLQITVEFIKFSPFGKPGERQGDQNMQSQQRQSTAQQYATMTTGTSPDAQASMGGVSQFAAGFGAFEQQDSDDEKIPF